MGKPVALYLYGSENKAKDTDALIEANSKLEKEVEELTWRLKVEKRIRAALEDLKNQESAKWQSVLKETQDQFEQTKEREAAKKARVDKLTTENEELKNINNSLKQKIYETEKKYEESNKLSDERLKQFTEAESKMLEMQSAMQRLQETIDNLETEEQILRHQVMLLTSSASKRRLSFTPKGQENGHLDHQGGTSMKRFDSSVVQSVIDRHRENVDIFIKATTEDLGFSNGKPIVTYVIYKSLLQWKVFEAERTNVFDRLITVFGSAIQKAEDNKHMAYWLSSMSTLLFLLQKSLSSVSGIPAPISLFGRMAQSFPKSPSYSNLEFIRQVDGKLPAFSFKKQLTAYVEKIFEIIRDNLKKELTQHISCCIHSAREKGDTPPSMHWQHIIESLNGMLKTLEEYHVPTILVQKIFSQVFSYMNVQLFNSMLLRRECCSFSHGKYLKLGLVELELWCSHALEEYADSSWDELKHTRQAVGFLVARQKSKIKYDHLVTELCPSLNVQQLYKICTHYADDIYKTPSLDPKIIFELKSHTEVMENADKTSFLLEDDPCIPFTVDDLVNFLHEKDFAEMKPTCYLVENPDFKFLLE